MSPSGLELSTRACRRYSSVFLQANQSLALSTLSVLHSISFTMHTLNIILQIHSLNLNKSGLPSIRINTISSIRRSGLTLIFQNFILYSTILLQSSCMDLQMDTAPKVLSNFTSTSQNLHQQQKELYQADDQMAHTTRILPPLCKLQWTVPGYYAELTAISKMRNDDDDDNNNETDDPD